MNATRDRAAEQARVISEGRCLRCYKPNAEAGRRLNCERCRKVKTAAKMAKRARLIAAGLCIGGCGNPPSEGSVMCGPHRAAKRRSNRESKRRKRAT